MPRSIFVGFAFQIFDEIKKTPHQLFHNAKRLVDFIVRGQIPQARARLLIQRTFMPGKLFLEQIDLIFQCPPFIRRHAANELTVQKFANGYFAGVGIKADKSASRSFADRLHHKAIFLSLCLTGATQHEKADCSANKYLYKLVHTHPVR